jgi:hypothetical protein
MKPNQSEVTMKKRWSIHADFVRLFSDGRVSHYDPDICSWRPGWGAWGTRTIMGDDAARVAEWRRAVRAYWRAAQGED